MNRLVELSKKWGSLKKALQHSIEANLLHGRDRNVGLRGAFGDFLDGVPNPKGTKIETVNQYPNRWIRRKNPCRGVVGHYVGMQAEKHITFHRAG